MARNVGAGTEPKGQYLMPGVGCFHTVVRGRSHHRINHNLPHSSVLAFFPALGMQGEAAQ